MAKSNNNWYLAKRNKNLYKYHKKSKLSYSKLGRIFHLDPKTVQDIILREKNEAHAK